eukprot:COSAG01_NODE_796_length_13536_cov_5.683635_16_plen_284_part_00
MPTRYFDPGKSPAKHRPSATDDAIAVIAAINNKAGNRKDKHQLKHAPVVTLQTSGDASVIVDGPSTFTDPTCAPAQRGTVPSHGNGSVCPSARTSCDEPTVRLPPAATDTAVMLPAVLRNVVCVTVAIAAAPTVSGTAVPSPRSSHCEMPSKACGAPAAPDTVTGVLISMQEPPNVAVPRVSCTVEPVSVPPVRLSWPLVPLRRAAVSVDPVMETFPEKVMLADCRFTICKSSCPPLSTVIVLSIVRYVRARLPPFTIAKLPLPHVGLTVSDESLLIETFCPL